MLFFHYLINILLFLWLTFFLNQNYSRSQGVLSKCIIYHLCEEEGFEGGCISHVASKLYFLYHNGQMIDWMFYVVNYWKIRASGIFTTWIIHSAALLRTCFDLYELYDGCVLKSNVVNKLPLGARIFTTSGLLFIEGRMLYKEVHEGGGRHF